MVHSDCAGPSHEAEFHEWYDQTSLPDVLSTPRFAPSSLYINTDQMPGKYLIIYEINSEDIDQNMTILDERLTKPKLMTSILTYCS